MPKLSFPASINHVAISGELAERPQRFRDKALYDIVIWKVRTWGPGGEQVHRVAIHDRQDTCSITLSRLKVGHRVLVSGRLVRTEYEFNGQTYKATEILCDDQQGFEIWYGPMESIIGFSPATPFSSWVYPSKEEWWNTMPRPPDEDDEGG
jgi:hypothetical protein